MGGRGKCLLLLYLLDTWTTADMYLTPVGCPYDDANRFTDVNYLHTLTNSVRQAFQMVIRDDLCDASHYCTFHMQHPLWHQYIGYGVYNWCNADKV